MDIERKINEIESKVKRLGAERSSFQHDNLVLLEENKQLKEKVLKQSKHIDELQNKLAKCQHTLTKEDGVKASNTKQNSFKEKPVSDKDKEELRK